MAVPQLTAEVVQASRTQAELAMWLDTTIEQFGDSPEGRETWRLYNGAFVKQVVEELRPIRWYADSFYAGDDRVFFEIVLGNQSYDAIIRDEDGNVIKYLQVTLAFDGYQSRLRMEHMTQYGHTPMTGVILERDNDGNIPEAFSEFENKNERIAAEFVKILDTFKKKADMRYEKNTVLIINFRSDGLIDDDYIRRLDSFVRDQILPINHDFSELVLVSGIPGKSLSYAANAT